MSRKLLVCLTIVTIGVTFIGCQSEYQKMNKGLAEEYQKRYNICIQSINNNNYSDYAGYNFDEERGICICGEKECESGCNIFGECNECIEGTPDKCEYSDPSVQTSNTLVRCIHGKEYKINCTIGCIPTGNEAACAKSCTESSLSELSDYCKNHPISPDPIEDPTNVCMEDGWHCNGNILEEYNGCIMISSQKCKTSCNSREGECDEKCQPGKISCAKYLNDDRIRITKCSEEGIATIEDFDCTTGCNDTGDGCMDYSRPECADTECSSDSKKICRNGQWIECGVNQKCNEKRCEPIEDNPIEDNNVCTGVEDGYYKCIPNDEGTAGVTLCLGSGGPIEVSRDRCKDGLNRYQFSGLLDEKYNTCHNNNDGDVASANRDGIVIKNQNGANVIEYCEWGCDDNGECVKKYRCEGSDSILECNSSDSCHSPIYSCNGGIINCSADKEFVDNFNDLCGTPAAETYDCNISNYRIYNFNDGVSDNKICQLCIGMHKASYDKSDGDCSDSTFIRRIEANDINLKSNDYIGGCYAIDEPNTSDIHVVYITKHGTENIFNFNTEICPQECDGSGDGGVCNTTNIPSECNEKSYYVCSNGTTSGSVPTKCDTSTSNSNCTKDNAANVFTIQIKDDDNKLSSYINCNNVTSVDVTLTLDEQIYGDCDNTCYDDLRNRINELKMARCGMPDQSSVGPIKLNIDKQYANACEKYPPGWYYISVYKKGGNNILDSPNVKLYVESSASSINDCKVTISSSEPVSD